MISVKNICILYPKYSNLKAKWMWVCNTRTKTNVATKKTYSHTILTPRTDFPARSSNTQKEEIQRKAKFSELYEWQRTHLKGQEFVLHDGPPYANGDLHMGHAVNKIIKDINNRSQILQGNKVYYVPGWDCHGLPIELKALQKAKKASKGNEPSDPIQIRKLAREFALEAVEKQKAAFESWGVMADWKKQCYLTLNKEYIQQQLKQFYEMYKKGLVYQALKPVYWSPSSRTALAEAELEYDPKYKSREVFVAFPLQKVPHFIKNVVEERTVSALIWTTTPWTLVVNKAICYNPSLTYSLVTFFRCPEEYFIMSTELIEPLKDIMGIITEKIEFEGSRLSNSTYWHPLTGAIQPLLPGAHVTAAKGTGLVHTAPAHGPEDFLVAINNNMKVECNVDESGCYANLDPEYNGLYVLKEGQELVISRLGEAVIHAGVYQHSYPLDWRTRQPVILRASRQWFVDTDKLKERALASLDGVSIHPGSSGAQSRLGLRAQLERRPYWCVSRQRAWGVPIPALYTQEKHIVDSRIIDKLCKLIDERGADAWWTCDVNELLTDDVRKEYELEGQEVVKGKDIMDIWLDSGLSWQTLGGRKARLYSEGVDQLTGWFQTSLLTSVGLKDEAPYESLFVHGFVVDDKKRKMSKSEGNVIDPHTIIHGGNHKNSPAYGIDTLRWWVACHGTQHSQIVISKPLLQDCHNDVIRIRNIFKYLLGVLSDLEKTDFDRLPPLNFLDKFMVRESHEFLSVVNEHYNNFRYNLVTQIALFFISNQVSALYCHCVKDRLYCSPKTSEQRLSAQLVIHTILVSLSKALAPILPHLIEEVWLYHPLYDKPFYFTENIPVLEKKAVDSELMETVLAMKKDVYLKGKIENLKKFSARIVLPSELFNKCKALNVEEGSNESVLCEIMQLSSVKLLPMLDDVVDKNWQIKLVESKKGQCVRCRKFNVASDSDKCERCSEAVMLMSG